MSVKKGDKAPGFALPCRPGEVVDVGAEIGERPIVLLFFPLAYSPVCTDEMCAIRDRWSDWKELDAAVFGISVDSPFVTDRFRADQGIPFPVLSDFNREVAATYDVLHENLKGLRGVAKRSAFVIDRDGTVTYRWSTDDPSVQVDFDAIRAALASAAAGAAAS